MKIPKIRPFGNDSPNPKRHSSDGNRSIYPELSITSQGKYLARIHSLLVLPSYKSQFLGINPAKSADLYSIRIPLMYIDVYCPI